MSQHLNPRWTHGPWTISLSPSCVWWVCLNSIDFAVNLHMWCRMQLTNKQVIKVQILFSFSYVRSSVFFSLFPRLLSSWSIHADSVHRSVPLRCSVIYMSRSTNMEATDVATVAKCSPGSGAWNAMNWYIQENDRLSVKFVEKCTVTNMIWKGTLYLSTIFMQKKQHKKGTLLH
jgi:hypothetical protein